MMKFTKTVESHRVKLFGYRNLSPGTLGGKAVINEFWGFCKEGRHYCLAIEGHFSYSLKDDVYFSDSGPCDGNCLHRNSEIPNRVIDAIYSIFGNRRKVVSDWDIVRHNRIVKRLKGYKLKD